MCSMTLPKLYYLAGLLDGEGCVSAHHEKSGYVRARITITNTDKNMVDWCKTHFGGYIHKRSKTGKRKSHWKDCYQWIINPSKKDLQLIEELIPILITKQKQMEIIREYILSLGNLGVKGRKTTPEVIAKRESFYLRLKGFNKDTKHPVATTTKRSGQ